jgi:hypothetical protein
LCMLLPQAASRQHENGAIGKRIVRHRRLNALVANSYCGHSAAVG